MRLLHCADIHLKADDKVYGLAVLREIVELATVNNVHALLICGDLFDSFADAESLRRDVAAIIDNCKCIILYIPGNHEELRKTGDLRSFDFGRLTLCAQQPFSLSTLSTNNAGVEFLCVPHQSNYASWRDWQIPQKKTAIRIGLFHGIVENMVYTGPADTDEESGAGAIGADFFTRNSIDYAALGHIHNGRQQQTGSALIAYSGSATVWRKGELGARSALLVNADTGHVSTSKLVVKSAGQYRSCPVPLSLASELPDLTDASAAFTANDHVEFVLSGLIENEAVCSTLKEVLYKTYKPICRKIDIDTSGIVVAPGIATHSLAKRFIDLWQSTLVKAPDTDREVLLRSRQLALLAIKKAMGARS